MIKQCAQCNKTFHIDSNDQDFYKRRAVPDPQLCPACRSQRRLAHRNETMLYSDECDLCHRSIISQYSPDKQFTVYCRDCWWSDRWNPFDYARNYNPNSHFFEQWADFIRSVPLINLLDMKSDNSEYTNCVSNNKNCYLIFTSDYNENCLYSNWLEHCRDCVDSFKLNNSEQAYQCFFGDRIYNSQYLIKCFSATESFYCYDCRNIQNCTLSWNLRNKQYYILNQPYSQIDYYKKLAEFELTTRVGRERIRLQFQQLMQQSAKHHYRNQLGRIENSTGDYVRDIHNCWQCFDIEEADHCRYVNNMIGVKDSMDCEYGGMGEDGYQNVETFPMPRHSMVTYGCYGGNDIYYSHSVMNSKNVFGSSGLKKAQYVIMNKQYSEADYRTVFNAIRTSLIEAGQWGQFFPIETSLFAYNETNAQHWYPLTRQQVEQRGWQYLETDNPAPSSAQRCTNCQRPFKYVAAETSFYEQHHMPAPQQCYQCRYATRRAWHNPQRLWQRQCLCQQTDHGHAERCAEQCDTSYAPDRPEVIYCNDCYQKTVY
ncbi:MAG: zinc-ribbon domain containing protein [Candidatus Kerfeldbacteria bacterium]|nr:zinc-ribbon domain containing protein [Candidatus Kerfeldbacteria bacterium]